MKTVLKSLGAALACSATLALAQQPKPSDFAMQEPLAVAQGAGLQRVEVPARMLARLQTAGAADLRVFNAAGQAVPSALHRPGGSPAERVQTRLAAYPIVGGGTPHTTPGVSLRIEQGASTRVIEVDAKGAVVPSQSTQTVAALIDARDITGAVVAIELDADFAANTPVRFTLETSRDLKSWQPLADSMVFRSADAVVQVPAKLDVRGASLDKQYLRVQWSGTDATDSVVTVRAATITTEASGKPAPRVRASLGALAPSSHTITFALPFATPIAALRIAPAGDNVLIPLRVMGRQAADLPWLQLASGVVYRLNADGKQQTNDFIDLGDASVRELMITADVKTPGFTAPPSISVEFEPLQLVFLASGAGPFTLAAGRAVERQINAPVEGALDTHLPIQSLIPGYTRGAQDKLPFAQLTPKTDAVDVKAPSVVVKTEPIDPKKPEQKLWLWGVLLLGVAALGGMVWVLAQQLKSPPASR